MKMMAACFAVGVFLSFSVGYITAAPLWIGRGCEGAKGPLMAARLSDLPACREIHGM